MNLTEREEGQWDSLAADKPEHRRGFRRFMLAYQYHVMFASLAMGFVLVGAYKLSAGHWFFSRLILLLVLLAFTPAAIVTFVHMREIGPFLFWTASNREWTTRRPRKTERAELTILCVLWLLIFLFVAYVVFRR